MYMKVQNHSKQVLREGFAQDTHWHTRGVNLKQHSYSCVSPGIHILV